MTGDQPKQVPSPPVDLRETTRAFVLKWIPHVHGSAAELLFDLEQELGWPARHVLAGVLDELRARRPDGSIDRKFLIYTLSEGAVNAALGGGLKRNVEHQSCLDELFGRSRRFRHTQKFAEAVRFISRFREYSPFNNMLVYLQNPLSTYFATARHWHKTFGRTIREEGRGMIILAPRTPVLLVYDVADTEGGPLPEKLEMFTKTSGRFNPVALDRTIKNCEREKIRVERKAMGPLKGGFSTARLNDPQWKMRVAVRDGLDDAAAYAVLCHELAHIFLGHLGADREGNWPDRVNLSQAVAEIEAEAVAHIVCQRAGLRTHSAEYLSTYTENGDDLDAISLDLISRAAGKIEEMGRRLLAPRQQVKASPA